jgi:hypothetical protein
MAEASTHTPDPDDLPPALTGEGVDPPAGEENTEGEENGIDVFGGANDEDIAFARANGWTEEYKGRPEDFESAKAYADRARGINRVLKAQNGDLQKRIAALEAGQRTIDQERAHNAEADRAAKLTTLRAQRVQAINDGDGAEFDRIEREIEQLGAPAAKPKPAAATEPQLSDEDKSFASEWRTRNTWVEASKANGRIATVIAAEVRDERPDLVGNVRGFMEEVERRARSEYPEFFKTMRHSRTEGGGNSEAPRATKTRAQNFDSLPKDARDECDKLIRRGVLKGDAKAARERYAKNYFEAYPQG